jgi:hypothetical protein
MPCSTLQGKPRRTIRGAPPFQNSALILAESRNLLMIGSRAKDTAVWIKSSRAVLDAWVVDPKVAETKNVDALVDAGKQIVDACRRCLCPQFDLSSIG